MTRPLEGYLVHVAITGYGPTGPRSARGAFDSLAQGLSGLAWYHSRDGRPQLLRTYLVDKATSAFAAQAAVAALLRSLLVDRFPKLTLVGEDLVWRNAFTLRGVERLTVSTGA